MTLRYFIQTFGCAANVADSERIAGMLEARGMKKASTIYEADHVVINTCMIRQSAENRVYGLVNNLTKLKVSARGGSALGRKIVVTGCMVGMAVRDTSGKFLKKLREKMPLVDEFLPIEEVGFDNAALRVNAQHAWVPISNGCNNFCTFCVVPFTRGREVSRPFADIIAEAKHLAKNGYTEITLIGQNVNSYGADLIQKSDIGYRISENYTVKPVYVKHLGRYRIPTLFPYLLEEICKIKGIQKIDFISSNPWDFSDELIAVIKNNKKISRLLHLPVQSGDNEMLKRMNRWYTPEEYIALVSNLKSQISNLKLSTDIIVGFCGETEKQFENTVELCKKVGFSKAYVAIYSDRPMTAAHKAYQDDVPYREKKRRWKILDELINQENLKKGTYPVEQYTRKRAKL